MPSCHNTSREKYKEISGTITTLLLNRLTVLFFISRLHVGQYLHHQELVGGVGAAGATGAKEAVELVGSTGGAVGDGGAVGAI